MTNSVKLSVSNIAWENRLDQQVANFLIESDISCVEIAPTRYHANVFSVTEFDMCNLKRRWLDLGISVSSLQSLLFNQPELRLFGDIDSRLRLKQLLLHLSKLASVLEAKALVFGAPKNRLRGTLDIKSAIIEAENFFRELDAQWFSMENFLVLEANPVVYGCDFLTKSTEARDFVYNLGLESLRWHLDTACTELGGESVLTLLSSEESLPAHIHLSEPNLAPLSPSKKKLYREFFSILNERRYLGFVVLEMRDTGDIHDLFRSISTMREAVVN